MPAVGVVTAISDPSLEAVVLAAISSRPEELVVVRRCVEIADALGVAASGAARVLVVGEGLGGLDADIVEIVSSYGVIPVAVGERGARWPVAFRFPVVLDSDLDPRELAEGLAAAADDRVATAREEWAEAQQAPAPPGRIVCVWGPAGAPGRSTIALALADEAARRGTPALLVDADVYGASIAAALALLDESPGIAAACRASSSGSLDLATLARTCLQIAPSLRLLTGISRSDRWPELQPVAMENVLDQARRLAALTVIDCGFAIEQDEELAYDTLAPRRNGATIAALEAADEILLVSGCEPPAVARGIRAVQEIRELLPAARVRVVVNRVRPGVFQGDGPAQLSEAFERFTGLSVAALLPWDQRACDLALVRGRMLAEVAPASPLRKAIAALAGTLPGVSQVAAGRRSARMRRGGLAHR